MTRGFVYALGSRKTDYIKIGRSEHMPAKRLKEVDRQIGYLPFAPWSLIDYIEIDNHKAAETYFHRSLRDRHVDDLAPANELFRLTPAEAIEILSNCPSEFLARADRLMRLSIDSELESFLAFLLRRTGLARFRDCEGLWTLVLYPTTAGGRLFTINIGQHEVAFATLPDVNGNCEFVFGADSRVMSARKARRSLPKGAVSWASMAYNAAVAPLAYASASEHLGRFAFHATIRQAHNFLGEADMMRGMVGYWMDHLLRFESTGQTSLHARHHNANAVRQILNRGHP